MQAPGRQQTYIEILSGWQMDVLALSSKSQVPNTLCALLVAVVPIQVGGWIEFTWLAFPGSCLLLTYSSFYNHRTSYMLCRSI